MDNYNIFPKLNLSPTSPTYETSEITSPKNKSPFQVRLSHSQISNSSSHLNKFNLGHYKIIVEKYNVEKTSKKELKFFKKNYTKLKHLKPITNELIIQVVRRVKNIFIDKCFSLYEEAVKSFEFSYKEHICQYALNFFKNNIDRTIEEYTNDKILEDVAGLFEKIEKDAQHIQQFFSEIKDLAIIPEEKVIKIFESSYSARYSLTIPSKMSLSDMGKQTNIFFQCITSKSSQLFEPNLLLRKVFLTKSLNNFQNFELIHLGYENQDQEITNTGACFTKWLLNTWDLHKYKENVCNEGVNKLTFIVEHFKTLCPQKEKKEWDQYLQNTLIKHALNLLANISNSNESIRIPLINIFNKHLIYLLQPQWLLIEKQSSTFYPCLNLNQFDDIFEDIDNLNYDNEKLKKISQNGESIIKKKMLSSAAMFNVYSAIIDHLATYSSEKHISLIEYLCVMKIINEQLTKKSQASELIKKIPGWLQNPPTNPLITLIPKKSTYLPGLSQGDYEGHLEPINENEIKKLLSPKISFRNTYYDEIENSKLTGITTEKGSCAEHIWGAATAQGKRPYQEDDYVQGVLSCVGNRKFPFFAVMDGHNSRTTVNFVKKNIHSTLTLWLNIAFAEIDKIENCSKEKQLIIIHNALKMSSVDLDRWLFKLSNKNILVGGSTLVVSIIDDDYAWQLNVGDSTALCYTKKDLYLMTEEAKPDIPFYEKRIIERGGQIESNRVNGTLAMANAIGDHQTIGRSSEGIITRYQLPKHKKIILLSDGVKDYLTKEEIHEIVRKNKNPIKIAKKLVLMAYKKGSEDNMTAFVIKVIANSNK